MYVWIWRHLPGGILGRLAGSLALLLGVVALLFFVIFPRVEHKLPFNDVTIDRTTQSPSPSASPGP